jgi:hypothetical protein
MWQPIPELNLNMLVAAVTQMQTTRWGAGAVKARSAAERGGGAERRGLDGAEHSATLDGGWPPNPQRMFSVLTLLELAGSRVR